MAVVIVLPLAYFYPQLGLLSSQLGIIMFQGILFVATGGIAVAVFSGIGIHRERKEVLRNIREKTADKAELGGFGDASLPSYMLADSIDHEILVTVREIGGDILDLQERLMKRGLVRAGVEFQRRISKSILLGLLYQYDDENRLYLTSAGLDAVNMPASLFVSSIPETIWNLVLKQKRHLSQEDWGGIVVATAQALEAAMQNLLERSIKSNPDEWDEISQTMPNRPIEKWSAGVLLGALRKLGIVKQHSLEDHLAGELIKIRNRIHSKQGEDMFGPSDADKCDIYMGLLLRSWFGLR